MRAKSLLLVVTSALVASAAVAAPALPDRPIRRAEVIAGVKRQFAAMDANHDGVVTPEEFQAYRARTAGAADTSPFDHVGGHWFEHVDTNGDGRVTLAEASVRPLQMFDTADVNHDGVVSQTEGKMALALMALTGR